MTPRKTDPAGLPGLVLELEALHGRPGRLPPRKALEWILWENVAYLVPDARRKDAYAALKKASGLSAAGILGLPRQELHDIAELGGMHRERRVEKLLSIADTVQDAFGGDLESVLKQPAPKARRALKRFPGIGDPGADKILLFTGAHAVPALESNGLRVLIRLGYAEEAKSYSTTYRAATAALAQHANLGGEWLMRAHDLLRAHGQTLCKRSAPLCDECPLADVCPSAG